MLVHGTLGWTKSGALAVAILELEATISLKELVNLLRLFRTGQNNFKT